jgi:hypothetical protein
MSTPSPGPGWWLASDGKWYPQRWEYIVFRSAAANFPAAVEEAGRQTISLGQQGWEMVNFTVQSLKAVATSAHGPSVRHEQWTVVFFMKRPVAP